eukprot:scaffold27785_cov81-Phaeocystis_antarctica.AAC.9
MLRQLGVLELGARLARGMVRTLLSGLGLGKRLRRDSLCVCNVLVRCVGVLQHTQVTSGVQRLLGQRGRQSCSRALRHQVVLGGLRLSLLIQGGLHLDLGHDPTDLVCGSLRQPGSLLLGLVGKLLLSLRVRRESVGLDLRHLPLLLRQLQRALTCRLGCLERGGCDSGLGDRLALRVRHRVGTRVGVGREHGLDLLCPRLRSIRELLRLLGNRRHDPHLLVQLKARVIRSRVQQIRLSRDGALQRRASHPGLRNRLNPRRLELNRRRDAERWAPVCVGHVGLLDHVMQIVHVLLRNARLHEGVTKAPTLVHVLASPADVWRRNVGAAALSGRAERVVQEVVDLGAVSDQGDLFLEERDRRFGGGCDQLLHGGLRKAQGLLQRFERGAHGLRLADDREVLDHRACGCNQLNVGVRVALLVCRWPILRIVEEQRLDLRVRERGDVGLQHRRAHLLVAHLGCNVVHWVPQHGRHLEVAPLGLHLARDLWQVVAHHVTTALRARVPVNDQLRLLLVHLKLGIAPAVAFVPLPLLRPTESEGRRADLSRLPVVDCGVPFEVVPRGGTPVLRDVDKPQHAALHRANVLRLGQAAPVFAHAALVARDAAAR